MKRIAPGPRRQGHGRGDPLADRRRARLRARGAEPAHAGAHLPRPPVHRRARRRHRALAREGDGHRVRHRRRLRHDQGDRPGHARPRRRDRLPLLLRLHVPPPPVLRRPAPRQLPAACPTARVAFLDFGLFKVMPRGADRDRARVPARRPRGRRASGCKQIWAETGFLTQPDRFRPDKLLAQFLDATWWYVTRRGDRARARDRHPGDDRHVRPALLALRADAPRDAAGRPPLRPPRRDAHARRARRSCARAATGTGSRASGCTTTSRSPSWAATRPRSGAPDRRAALVRLAALAARGRGRDRGGPARRAARRRAPCAAGSRDVRDWVDGARRRWRRWRSSRVSALLTPLMFPGPLLAGASGLLFGTALGFPVTLAGAVLGACLAFSISRYVARRRDRAAGRAAAAARSRSS